ncbi:methanol o-anthraniloyltransferase [Nicotiana attenuata]|uniref:Methanol o-anthraniloyltransferase n=2 Tax=Nicotiana attenuata TaxID=49451 RepID=A0A314KX06_NICAT|nr:methanol o-anthraniloyltransferase [Nicotiana attenuata]
MSYLVTARERFESLKIPHGYYGNAFSFSAVVSKAGHVGIYPLTYALELVKKAKKQVNEEYFRSLADLMVIKGRPIISFSWNFAISNIAHVGFDKVDFGWGEPKYGGVAKAHSFVSYIVPCKSNKGEKGILVPISLPPRAIERFEDSMYKIITSKVVKGLKKVAKI